MWGRASRPCSLSRRVLPANPKTASVSRSSYCQSMLYLTKSLTWVPPSPRQAAFLYLASAAYPVLRCRLSAAPVFALGQDNSVLTRPGTDQVDRFFPHKRIKAVPHFFAVNRNHLPTRDLVDRLHPVEKTGFKGLSLEQPKHPSKSVMGWHSIG